MCRGSVNMRQLQVLFLCALLGYSVATEVQSCDGDSPHEHAEDLQVGTCVKPPCKLKRKTSVNLEFKFTADNDVPSLKNNVHAKILGVPFPFLGVDGTDACDQIYKLDGTKAGCPLKKGEQYLYKNSIRVHEAYPKLRVVVHWALTGPGEKDVLCFNTPAKITS